MPVIKPSVLTSFVRRLLLTAGASEDGASLVAQSLVNSNLAGHDSHGVIRVRQYLDAITAGILDPGVEPTIVRESGSVTMVDARHGFGQVAAHFAMEVTINKARAQGLAATGLFNCNHVGRLGEWVQAAADADMIGMAYCNGGRPGGWVTPFGGSARRLGTNPFASVIPVAGRPPVLIDFATSMAAEGKVRVAKNQGKSLPEGWIQDSQGLPSTTPDDLYDGGALIPLGEHKGYCMSLLMEFMGGVLTGQGNSGLPNYTTMRNGVIFMALSIEAFRPLEDFLNDGAALCDLMKTTPPAPDIDEVLVPGEPEHRASTRRQTEGIPIDETTWQQLTDAAAEWGVEVPRPLL